MKSNPGVSPLYFVWQTMIEFKNTSIFLLSRSCKIVTIAIHQKLTAKKYGFIGWCHFRQGCVFVCAYLDSLMPGRGFGIVHQVAVLSLNHPVVWTLVFTCSEKVIEVPGFGEFFGHSECHWTHALKATDPSAGFNFRYALPVGNSRKDCASDWLWTASGETRGIKSLVQHLSVCLAKSRIQNDTDLQQHVLHKKHIEQISLKQQSDSSAIFFAAV